MFGLAVEGKVGEDDPLLLMVCVLSFVTLVLLCTGASYTYFRSRVYVQETADSNNDQPCS